MAINNNRFLVKNGLDNNSKTITNVADPVNAQDVATRAYVLANVASGGTLATVTAAGASTSTFSTFSGGLSAATLTASGNRATHVQGGYIEWNKSAGGGETWLLNQKGGGSGGIFFGEVDTANVTTERMRIDSVGNVGIGGTAFSKLDVYGAGTIRGSLSVQDLDNSGSSIVITSTDASYTALTVANSSSTIALSSNGAQSELRTGTATPIVFMTNSVERARIDATGLIGFGGTPVTSQGHLQVLDTVAGGTATSARFANTSLTANSAVLLSLDPGNNGISVRDAQIRAVNDGSNNINLQFWTAAANTPTEKLRIGHAGQIGIGGANYGTAGQAIISGGSGAAPAWGSPKTLSTTRSDWSTNGTISVAVGQLAWKNYGNGHTIFDASAGTSPDGGAVNSSNSAQAWTASFPTLMGWNGAQTYGVRVDSARVADSATTAANYLPLAGGTMTGNITITSGNIIMAPGGTTRGLLYADAGACGFLNSSSSWALQIPTGTSNVNCSGDLSVAANSYIGGVLTVGNGQVNSYITMYDSDEGNRSIHCNSNRIGFLTQAGGWGSYCTDDGSWVSDVNISAAGSVTANTVYTNNWYRSNGNSGWYSETYAGGIWMTDSLYVRTYNNKSFVAHSYVEVAQNFGTVSGAQNINVLNGSMVSMTLNGATTFTFSGAPSAGYAASFTLELTNGGTYTITWPTGTKWAAGAAPTLTASGTDILSFYTRDGGTTWRGVLVSKDNR